MLDTKQRSLSNVTRRLVNRRNLSTSGLATISLRNRRCATSTPMTIPAGMTDLFPAFALGGVALMGLMARIQPPPAVRWCVVGMLGRLLVLYLSDQLHMWLPDKIGLPLYGALLAIAGAIILWNRHMARAAKRR